MRLIISIILSIFVASCGGGGASEVTSATVTLSNARFTKIDSDGNSLSSTAENWSCTLDNSTGLMWEVKTDDGGLRDKDWVYTAYENTGTNGSGSCDTTKTCNQSLFRDAVNVNGLCGYKNWRLARLTELETLQDSTKTQAPYINTDYFPFTATGKYWTTAELTSSANPRVPWVNFAGVGSGSTPFRDLQFSVRLVRP
jgi:hypothetical protein